MVVTAAAILFSIMIVLYIIGAYITFTKAICIHYPVPVRLYSAFYCVAFCAALFVLVHYGVKVFL